jgi:hypothetical protein
MHNRDDQFAKNVLRDALSRACAAETEVEVLAATQKIDVYSVPDPARAAERAQMGLLGELSAEPSLFEPFHDTPTLRKVRRCINKQHTWHHELERRARRAAGSPPVDTDLAESAQEAVAFPALVVISPGRPETVLEAYGCKPVRPGVYHGVWGLALRVVVLVELPGPGRPCCCACSVQGESCARRWPIWQLCPTTPGRRPSRRLCWYTSN